jgi:hypothetical protein
MVSRQWTGQVSIVVDPSCDLQGAVFRELSTSWGIEWNAERWEKAYVDIQGLISISIPTVRRFLSHQALPSILC